MTSLTKKPQSQDSQILVQEKPQNQDSQILVQEPWVSSQLFWHEV